MRPGKTYQKITKFFSSAKKVSKTPWYSIDLMVSADNLSKRAKEMKHDKVGANLLESEARRLYTLAKRAAV